MPGIWSNWFKPKNIDITSKINVNRNEQLFDETEIDERHRDIFEKIKFHFGNIYKSKTTLSNPLTLYYYDDHHQKKMFIYDKLNNEINGIIIPLTGKDTTIIPPTGKDTTLIMQTIGDGLNYIKGQPIAENPVQRITLGGSRRKTSRKSRRSRKTLKKQHKAKRR